MAGKLWDKGYEPDKMIEEYTVGDDRELDMRLARYDVEGSLAHIAMLETIGLLTAEELENWLGGAPERPYLPISMVFQTTSTKDSYEKCS